VRATSQPHHRGTRAAARGRCLADLDDERMAPAEVAHTRALHAAPAAVDQTDLVEAGLGGRFQVGLDDGRNLPRREAVEIDRVLDGNRNRVQRVSPTSRI
jgi:hypothetical protein